jgi:lysophospholipase
MCPNVATLRLFPGISASTIKAFFMPPVKGVVLETFGAGNAPQRADLMQALKEACDRGVVVVAITQCVKGNVSDAYETGRTLLQVGIVPGGDMTPEVNRPLVFEREENINTSFNLTCSVRSRS